MKLKLLFSVLCGFSVSSWAASAAPPVEMTLQKLSDHCYYVQGAAGMATDNAGFISNAGVIVTSTGVVVIDALGTPALAQMLLDKIRTVTEQPISKVIVTHYHADHMLGLQVFADLGAEIIAPHGVNDYLNLPVAQQRLDERRQSLAPWVDAQTRLVAPDRMVETQTELTVGDVDLTLSYLGSAHSEGDLSVLVKNDKVLYSGDVIFEGRVPFVGNADTQHWLAVLTDLQTSGLSTLVPGHGPANQNPAIAIQLTRDYLAFLREQMGSAAENFVPFDEAYAAVDWSPYYHLPAFSDANRRNAYQVFLSIEAELLGK